MTSYWFGTTALFVIVSAIVGGIAMQFASNADSGGEAFMFIGALCVISLHFYLVERIATKVVRNHN